MCRWATKRSQFPEISNHHIHLAIGTKHEPPNALQIREQKPFLLKVHYPFIVHSHQEQSACQTIRTTTIEIKNPPLLHSSPPLHAKPTEENNAKLHIPHIANLFPPTIPLKDLPPKAVSLHPIQHATENKPTSRLYGYHFRQCLSLQGWIIPFHVSRGDGSYLGQFEAVAEEEGRVPSLFGAGEDGVDAAGVSHGGLGTG